jgi:hypothetical protein
MPSPFPLKKLDVENPAHEYDEYQDHPLNGVPLYILKAARAAVEEARIARFFDHDLDEEDVEAIADHVVLALRERGYING